MLLMHNNDTNKLLNDKCILGVCLYYCNDKWKARNSKYISTPSIARIPYFITLKGSERYYATQTAVERLVIYERLHDTIRT